MVPSSIAQPDADCEINILGTVKILNACRLHGVKRVVFASSAATYGDLDAIPLKEDAVIIPTSFYGLSKLAAEKYLRTFHQLFGQNYAVLRFANVYGEKQCDNGEGGVVSIFVRKIKNGQTMEIFGDGGQTRDFIYAGDVAEANCLALTAPLENINRIYNVSAMKQTSVNDLTRILAEAAGKEANVVHIAPRKGDIYHSMLDNTSTVAGLDWYPKVGLAEGLKRTYDDLARTI
jgi:UDP-glucose 4-epimerase